ncbi:Uncharacterised protein [Klebsiella pneumoniae]|uniref:Uncharacterized protein n=1 Tax=Klebsiella pneumoniae TaxID=573 RepID=A0A3S4KBC8_KLEPN|nr:Uncharacterised protein [Klebsiella pneumoniae]
MKFFLRNGYTSRQELEQWQAIIRQAAESETDDDYMSMVSDRLRKTYDLQVSKAGALGAPQGAFTLHAELHGSRSYAVSWIAASWPALT